MTKHDMKHQPVLSSAAFKMQ